MCSGYETFDHCLKCLALTWCSQICRNFYKGLLCIRRLLFEWIGFFLKFWLRQSQSLNWGHNLTNFKATGTWIWIRCIDPLQWDKAIACAPHVSMEYWKSLVDRRAESLMDEESEEAIAYSIAGGNLEETVQVGTTCIQTPICGIYLLI